jgi:hypothetical protein
MKTTAWNIFPWIRHDGSNYCNTSNRHIRTDSATLKQPSPPQNQQDLHQEENFSDIIRRHRGMATVTKTTNFSGSDGE